MIKDKEAGSVKETNTQMVQITKEMLHLAKTKRGGYSSAQVAIAKRITGANKWKAAMLGMDVKRSDMDSFIKARTKTKAECFKKTKRKTVNKMSVNTGDDWSWKPDASDVPAKKLVKSGSNKKRRQKVSKKDNGEFYRSREWLELRVRVLEKYRCACMMCGRTPKEHKIIIHVDHIKPRSKYPELSLAFDNLQLLCADCNRGKSNKYETDYRPDHLDDDERELLCGAINAGIDS